MRAKKVVEGVVRDPGGPVIGIFFIFGLWVTWSWVMVKIHPFMTTFSFLMYKWVGSLVQLFECITFYYLLDNTF